MIITDITKLNEPAKPIEFLTETGIDKTEVTEIVDRLVTELKNSSANAISGPQIGLDSRIFGIKFDDTIKVFINPIITKKDAYVIAPEICVSMPNKEILITRPEEVTAVYYNAELKYEENKFLGAAARIFDQQCQFLDGITPADLGLVSDITEDGSFADMSEEELKEAQEIYIKYIKLKTEAFNKALAEEDEATTKLYNRLKLAENVINGRAQVVKEPTKMNLNRATRRAMAKASKRGR